MIAVLIWRPYNGLALQPRYQKHGGMISDTQPILQHPRAYLSLGEREIDREAKKEIGVGSYWPLGRDNAR
jgi:hypothetical protein